MFLLNKDTYSGRFSFFVKESNSYLWKYDLQIRKNGTFEREKDKLTAEKLIELIESYRIYKSKIE